MPTQLQDTVSQYGPAYRNLYRKQSREQTIDRIRDTIAGIVERKERREKEDRDRAEREAARKQEQGQFERQQGRLEEGKEFGQKQVARAEGERSDEKLQAQEQAKLLEQVETRRDAKVQEFNAAQDDAGRMRVLAEIRSMDARARRLGGEPVGDALLKDFQAFQKQTAQTEGAGKPIGPATQRYIDMMRQWADDQSRTPAERMAAMGMMASAEVNGVTGQELELAMGLVNAEREPQGGGQEPPGIEAGEKADKQFRAISTPGEEGNEDDFPLGDYITIPPDAPEDVAARIRETTFNLGRSPGPGTPERVLFGEGATTTKSGAKKLGDYIVKVTGEMLLWRKDNWAEDSRHNITNPEVLERQAGGSAVNGTIRGEDTSWYDKPAVENFPEIQQELERPKSERIKSVIAGMQNSTPPITATEVQINRDQWASRFKLLGLTVDEVLAAMRVPQ